MPRPAGSKNINPPVVDVAKSQCPKCQSTEREKYTGSCAEQTLAGIDPAGIPYTHLVRYRTRCTKCGQWRIDRVFENRPQK